MQRVFFSCSVNTIFLISSACGRFILALACHSLASQLYLVHDSQTCNYCGMVHISLFIDENPMLGLRTLAQIDSCYRQLFPKNANLPFGGLNVALVGYFAQLPPVGDTPLYSPPSTAASENGCLSRDGSVLYRQFRQSFRLQVIHRQGGDSLEQVTFRNLLSHASRGGLNQEEWQLLNSRS